MRPLSESINDLFREVSQLHRRITELSHRLATLEPFLHRHGYRGGDGEQTRGSQALKGEVVSLARYALKNTERPKGSRVVRRRRVRVLKNPRADSEWIKQTEGERMMNLFMTGSLQCSPNISSPITIKPFNNWIFEHTAIKWKLTFPEAYLSLLFGVTSCFFKWRGRD